MSSERWTSRWGGAGALAGAGALLVLAFYRSLLSGERVLISRDVLRVYYPLRQYWADRVGRGEFPEWYPYDGLGQSYVGMVVSGALHPSNLLHLVLPHGFALSLSVLLSASFALTGTYLLARRLEVSTAAASLAAVAFAFNGYSVAITNNLLYLMGLATVPWVLWAVDRCLSRPSVLWALVAAALHALILLAGDAQSYAVTGALLGAVLLARPRERPTRALRWLALILVLSACIAAPQLLPALAVAKDSVSTLKPLAERLVHSLHPWRLVELGIGALTRGGSGLEADEQLADRLFEAQGHGLWVASVYVGAPVLILAVAGVVGNARRRATLVVVGAFLVLLALALGRHVGAWELVYAAVPPWRAFRYPEKLVPFLMLGIALGAAAGLSTVERSTPARRAVAIASLLIGGGVAVMVAASVALSFGAEARAGATVTATWSLVFGLALSRGNERRLGGAAVAAAAAALFMANQGLVLTADAQVLALRPGSASLVLEGWEGPGRPRVLSIADRYAVPIPAGVTPDEALAATLIVSLAPVTPAFSGIEGLRAYLPGVTARSGVLAELARADPLGLGPLAGVSHVVVDTARLRAEPALEQKVMADFRDHGFHVLALEPLPPAYAAGRRCVSNERAALVALAQDEDVRGGRVVIGECEAPELPAPSAARVTWKRRGAEALELTVRSSERVVLTFTDAFYPGWAAFVDGAPVALQRVNFALRGLEVPAGEHDVRLRYRTPMLRPALFLAAAAIAGPVLFAVVAALVERRRVGRASSVSAYRADGPRTRTTQ